MYSKSRIVKQIGSILCGRFLSALERVNPMGELVLVGSLRFMNAI